MLLRVLKSKDSPGSVPKPSDCIPPACATLIAERRTAEERSRRSEDLLESINRNVNEGLFRTDASLRLSYANIALARMLGYETPEQVIGSTLSDAFTDPTRRTEMLELVRTRGHWLNEEVQLRRCDGSAFWSLLTANAGYTAQGDVVFYDGAVADITSRKAMEEQFRQAQKMEAVGKLAGGVAHDFNNLLTVIIGYAECLQSDLTNPALRAYAESVLDAAQSAARLTQQLLAYGRRQLLPRVVELNAIVDRMSNMLRRIIGEHIRLQVEHSSGSCWVRVDPGQLEQVLLNLAVNARDAMQEGGALTISTSLEEIDESMVPMHPDHLTGKCVLLRVQDSGAGMAPEVVARAFDPFFTTKEMGRGTGLGLATVYGIVKQSGGAVWLDSAPGRGTTATIQLRCESAPSDISEEPGQTIKSRGKGEGTILVAEDEPVVRRLVCSTLTNYGYRVLEATDGAQALRMLDHQRSPVRLLITDVVMPAMSGRELALRLRHMRPGMPVLFMSGYPDEERAGPKQAVDGSEFLAKPFTSSLLLERVVALLSDQVV